MGTILLPPSQLAINGHCLQFQQGGQGPDKLSDGSAISSVEVAFSKKIAPSCQDQDDKGLQNYQAICLFSVSISLRVGESGCFYQN